jgi:glycosyltransferase involved in cell wall biosynthesis
MPHLVDLLSSSKALLLPSSYETVGYVILEAFASGLPVIVSQAIPSEIVSDSQNGFVVPSMDAAKYAAKLSILLSDDSLWTSLSKQAIKTASEFDHLKIAKEYERLIETSLR